MANANLCIASSIDLLDVSNFANISITRLLSLLSRSNALIVAHMIKNKFSSAYCYMKMFILTSVSQLAL